MATEDPKKALELMRAARRGGPRGAAEAKPAAAGSEGDTATKPRMEDASGSTGGVEAEVLTAAEHTETPDSAERAPTPARKVSEVLGTYINEKRKNPTLSDKELINQAQEIVKQERGWRLDEEELDGVWIAVEGDDIANIRKADRADSDEVKGVSAEPSVSREENQELVDKRERVAQFLDSVHGESKTVGGNKGRWWEDKDNPGSALVIRRRGDDWFVWRIRPEKSNNFGTREKPQSKTRTPNTASGWTDDDPKFDKFGAELADGGPDIVPLDIPADFVATVRKRRGEKPDSKRAYAQERIDHFQKFNSNRLEKLEREYNAKNNKNAEIDELISKNKDKIEDAKTPDEFSKIADEHTAISNLITALSSNTEATKPEPAPAPRDVEAEPPTDAPPADTAKARAYRNAISKKMSQKWGRRGRGVDSTSTAKGAPVPPVENYKDRLADALPETVEIQKIIPGVEGEDGEGYMRAGYDVTYFLPGEASPRTEFFHTDEIDQDRFNSLGQDAYFTDILRQRLAQETDAPAGTEPPRAQSTEEILAEIRNSLAGGSTDAERIAALRRHEADADAADDIDVDASLAPPLAPEHVAVLEREAAKREAKANRRWYQRMFDAIKGEDKQMRALDFLFTKKRDSTHWKPTFPDEVTEGLRQHPDASGGLGQYWRATADAIAIIEREKYEAGYTKLIHIRDWRRNSENFKNVKLPAAIGAAFGLGFGTISAVMSGGASLAILVPVIAGAAGATGGTQMRNFLKSNNAQYIWPATVLWGFLWGGLAGKTVDGLIDYVTASMPTKVGDVPPPSKRFQTPLPDAPSEQAPPPGEDTRPKLRQEPRIAERPPVPGTETHSPQPNVARAPDADVPRAPESTERPRVRVRVPEAPITPDAQPDSARVEGTPERPRVINRGPEASAPETQSGGERAEPSRRSRASRASQIFERAEAVPTAGIETPPGNPHKFGSTAWWEWMDRYKS